MSSRIAQWIGLIGIAATIPLVQTVATAKSSVEVAETARTITVLITSSNGQGSGVILKQEGDIYTVLTAAHVVKKKVNYQITTPDDKQYQVMSNSIVSAPGDIDLAVVKFKATAKYPLAKLGNCNILTRGMELYVAGFPGMDRAITSSILVVREGKISANSHKTFDKGYSLIYSNDTLNGMSGGAVLNNNGELVAIHGVGDRDEDGRKNGFNLGIPIERFGTVANKMGVSLNGQVAAIPRDTAPKVDDYLASGVQKYQKGDYPGALADYDKLIAIAPKERLAYIGKSLIKIKLGDKPGAILDLSKAIALDPNNRSLYAVRGGLKFESGDKKGALSDYDKLIEIDPKDDTNYSARSEIRLALGDKEGALTDYNSAIKINPNYAEAYNNRGNLKNDNLNDPQGALADYNSAIKINPNYAFAYNNRGIIKKDNLNDPQGALADYNRAIKINPNYAEAYNNRGNLKNDNLNDPQGALTDYNRALQINPNYAFAYNNRGNLKKDNLNDPQGALADYNRALQINPNYAEAYYNRGNLKTYKLNNYQGALADYNRAIQINPNYAKAYNNRSALKFYLLKDRAGGIDDMKQAARLYQQQGNIKDYQKMVGLLKEWQQTSGN
jgi:tetratricopeptide (TPR) repeat protein